LVVRTLSVPLTLEWVVPSVLTAALAAWAPWVYATRRSVQEALGALRTTGPVALRPHFARLERELVRPAAGLLELLASVE